MSMAHEVRRLRAEHSTLAALAQRALDLVAAPQPAPPSTIAPLRDELRDTLIRHLKCEDWALYPRLRWSGDPGLLELARGFVAEIGHLAGDFAAYDAKWTPARIAAEWTGFGRETTVLMKALQARIESEERDLYPVVERLDRAALSARRADAAEEESAPRARRA